MTNDEMPERLSFQPVLSSDCIILSVYSFSLGSAARTSSFDLAPTSKMNKTEMPAYLPEGFHVYRNRLCQPRNSCCLVQKKKKKQLITLRQLLISFHRISPEIDINSVICNFCLNIMSLGCFHLPSPKWNWIKYVVFAFWCLNILKLI